MIKGKVFSPIKLNIIIVLNLKALEKNHIVR